MQASSRNTERVTGSIHMQGMQFLGSWIIPMIVIVFFFSIEGMPVSQGTVEGRARVVLDVKDAVDIQVGSVLFCLNLVIDCLFYIRLVRFW